MAAVRWDRVAAVLACGMLAGCGTLGLGGDTSPRASASNEPSTLQRIIDGNFAPADQQPVVRAARASGAPLDPNDEPQCPYIDILPNSAAIQVYGSGGAQAGSGALRHQIAITQVARECRVVPGGLAVKVGVEGRVLLGAQGSAGSFPIPLRFEARRGERVLSTRNERATVTVPAGEGQALFSFVTGEFTIPDGDGDAEIGVGIGASAGEQRSARRARR